MKKLLLTLLGVAGVFAAMAQCTPSYTAVQYPENNDLLRVIFTNTTGYTPSPNTGVFFNLDYGDGTWTNGWEHNYQTPGTYNSSMTMSVYDSTTNSYVCSSSAAIPITVSYPPCGSQISATNMGSGVFNFTSMIPAGTAGITYLWNFGDGTTANTANPTHTYSNVGNYMVTLVTTANGSQYTNTMFVAVSGLPLSCATLSTAFTYTTSNNEAFFYVNSTPLNGAGMATISNFDYGDGSADNQATHAYSAAGSYWVTLSTYWIDSITNNSCFDSIGQWVTVGAPIYSLSGNIYYDSVSPGQPSFMVYLVQVDPIANTLTAVDSQQTLGWGMSSFSFSNPAPGSYLVKAAPLGQTPGTAGMVPTYHDSSLYWNAASSIYFSGAGNVYGANIWMQNGTVTSGPGFVGGNISAGANKGTSSGVPGILVFLRNTSTGKMISSSVTDANGNYSFSNIPSGVYNVYPEDINHVTTPSSSYTVYSSGQVSYTDVNFLRNSTTIVPVTLGVSDVSSSSSVFALYPNPAQDQITISTERAATVTVSNVTGAKVMEMKVKAGGDKVSVEGLSNGVYLIRVSNGTASQTQKLMIQR